jgi:hypothetical protein
LLCWKCPVCDTKVCDSEPISAREPVMCDRCESRFARSDVLCVVCETRNTLVRRDTLHYWCVECGHTQTLWSETG